MAIEVYLGKVPTNIENWIKANSQPVGHSDTRVTYVAGSEIEDWSEEIVGELTNESIPDSLDVKTVDIGTSVTSIGNEAFSYCQELTDVMIPNNVESIGYKAFYSCQKLSNVVFQGKTLSQVQAMDNYPWGISNINIITVA